MSVWGFHGADRGGESRPPELQGVKAAGGYVLGTGTPSVLPSSEWGCSERRQATGSRWAQRKSSEVAVLGAVWGWRGL